MRVDQEFEKMPGDTTALLVAGMHGPALEAGIEWKWEWSEPSVIRDLRTALETGEPMPVSGLLPDETLLFYVTDMTVNDEGHTIVTGHFSRP